MVLTNTNNQIPLPSLFKTTSILTRDFFVGAKFEEERGYERTYQLP
jgi:hypothetical protein